MIILCQYECKGCGSSWERENPIKIPCRVCFDEIRLIPKSPSMISMRGSWRQDILRWVERSYKEIAKNNPGQYNRCMSKKHTIKLDDMVDIKGITKNQTEVIKEYKKGKCLFLYGSAGTGKTFVTLYHALKEVLDPKSKYQCVYVVRSLISTREIGFLPGDEEDKSALYQVPYDNMVRFMFKMPTPGSV